MRKECPVIVSDDDLKEEDPRTGFAAIADAVHAAGGKLALHLAMGLGRNNQYCQSLGMEPGYLVDQFMSACWNRRTDQYGGSLENRCRFAAEAIAAVKRNAPGVPVSFRISVDHPASAAISSAPVTPSTARRWAAPSTRK